MDLQCIFTILIISEKFIVLVAMGFRVTGIIRPTKVQTHTKAPGVMRALRLTLGILRVRVGSDTDLGPKSSMGHIFITGPIIRIFDAATITTRSELGASALTFNLIEARRLPQSGMGCVSRTQTRDSAEAE